MNKILIFIIINIYISIHETVGNNYQFKELNISNGLSHSKVNHICMDHKGYVWISTPYGLNRFDGDEMKVFYHDEEDSLSLPSSDILFTLDDHLNNLWIGTQKGLCRYNQDYDYFEKINYKGKQLSVFSAIADSNGVLLGGIGELYKYDYKSKKIIQLEMKKDTNFYSSFQHIIKYSTNKLLLNTRWHGIYQYDLTSHHIIKLNYINKGNYNAIYVDTKERIWVSIYGKGLFCYKDGKLIKHFNSNNSSLNYDVIHTIEEKDNQLWLGTDGGGINILNLNDFSFAKPFKLSDEYNSFPTNSIYCLYKDPMDNMWTGSIRNGVIYIYNSPTKSFKGASYKSPYSLSNPTINCIIEDSNRDIWIGTDGGGINKYSPINCTFQHYKSTYNEKITSIVEYNNDELLIYIFNKGLYLFNKHTGQKKIFKGSLNRKFINNEGYSVFSCRLNDGSILFSAEYIYIYNISTDKYNIIATKDTDYISNSPRVKEGINGKLYIIDVNKILVYDRRNDKTEIIYKSSNTINDINIDANNTIWIGTSNGIYSYNTVTKKEKRLKPDLLHSIRVIQKDHEGHLWIGTSLNRLFMYDISSEQILLMESANGFMNNEYTINGMLISESGETYIGGTMGLTIVEQGISFNQNSDCCVMLANVTVNGKNYSEQFYKKSLNISLPHNFNSIKLKLNINKENIFRKHAFKYIISNKDRKEVAHTFKHSIELQYLPEGQNQIAVSYITSGGEWSQPEIIAKINILPPWWKSTWFITSCCIMLITTYIIIAHTLYKKSERKRDYAIKEAEERFSDEKIQFLANISHELQTPLTLITSPLKEIIDNNTLTPQLNNKIYNIYKQSLHIKHLIDLVLEVKKIKKGEQSLNIALHPLNKWLRESTKQCMHDLGLFDIMLEYELEEYINNVPFDKEKCSFILNSFIINAVKISKNCKIISIISKITENKMIRIEVKINTPTIGDVDISKLFSLYYQLKNRNSEDSIRLSYSKSLMDLHNGKIGVTNNISEGLTFYFEIPTSHIKTQYNEEEISIAYPEKEIDFTQYRNCSILIISESKDFRNYLKVSLHKHFDHVYIAQNGKDGITLVKSIMPDLIISDLIMSHIDGFKVCQQIKEEKSTRHIPIILVTAYNTPTNIATAYRLGADIFLSKPFSNNVLFSIINNLLNVHKKIKKTSSLIKNKSGATIINVINNADNRFIERLNEIIIKNIDDVDLNVKFLTENMGVSRTLLFNKIKDLKEMSIVDYINYIRIEKASLLLKTTTLNISEISIKTGFTSPQYFSRVFKHFKGITPTEYRNKESK